MAAGAQAGAGPRARVRAGPLVCGARYTHRTAISNNRLLGVDGEEVVFTWRDRAHGDRRRTMRLHAHEFLRRFLLHLLPDGFVRIRSYGLLATRDRRAKLTRCRHLLGQAPAEPPAPVEEAAWAELLAQLTGTDPTRCPKCGMSPARLNSPLLDAKSPPLP